MGESDGRVIAEIGSLCMIAGQGDSLEHIVNRLVCSGSWLSAVACAQNWVLLHRISTESSQGDIHTIIRKLVDMFVPQGDTLRAEVEEGLCVLVSM